VAGRLEVKDADARKTVKTRQAILDGEEFKALWERIKQKTTYRVQFDNEDLIRQCTKAVNEAVNIDRPHLVWRSADLAIGRAGVETTETGTSSQCCVRSAALSGDHRFFDVEPDPRTTGGVQNIGGYPRAA